MQKPIYIHYGGISFDKSLFQEPKNRFLFNKPTGGLWASRIDAKYGWKDWCRDEQYADCKEENSFRFVLKDGTNLFHIYSKSDIESLPMLDISNSRYDAYPDFEKTLSMGYDAIEYHLSDEWKVKHYEDSIYYVLYGWDCDSILILNKDVVVPVK